MDRRFDNPAGSGCVLGSRASPDPDVVAAAFPLRLLLLAGDVGSWCCLGGSARDFARFLLGAEFAGVVSADGWS